VNEKTQKPKEELPKGYKCSACGHFNPFVSYVYAHWRDELMNDCAGCGLRHTVIAGRARPDAQKATP
jgi:transcription elongation factor Elf1